MKIPDPENDNRFDRLTPQQRQTLNMLANRRLRLTETVFPIVYREHVRAADFGKASIGSIMAETFEWVDRIHEALMDTEVETADRMLADKPEPATIIDPGDLPS